MGTCSASQGWTGRAPVPSKEHPCIASLLRVPCSSMLGSVQSGPALGMFRGRMVLQSTKLCLLPTGWEHTTVPCVCLCRVSRDGNVVLSRRDVRGAGCAGQAGTRRHTAPLCSQPPGSMRHCSPARAALAPGPSQAVPGLCQHRGAPRMGPQCCMG